MKERLKLNLHSQAQSGSTSDVSTLPKKAPLKQAEPVKDKIPEEVSKAPKQVFDFFTAESMVKRMVNDSMYPVLIKFPSVQTDIKHLQQEVRNLQGTIKNQQKEIQFFRQMTNQLRDQERLVKNFEQTFRSNCLSIQEHMQKQDVTTDRFNNKFEEIYSRMIEDKKTLDRRFRSQEEQQRLYDEKQEKFIQRFDVIFETINMDRQSIEKKLHNFDTEVNTLKYLTDQVRNDFKSEIKKVLDDVAKKREKDQLKIFNLNQQIKELRLNKAVLDVLEKQIQDCQKKQNENVHTHRFLSKSLPILIHLQICEALDKVVGESFPRQLLSYEKTKNKIIREYIDTADVRCIKAMNEKLPVFIKYMYDSELGSLPFVYGDDVFPEMSEELKQHIDQTQIIRLRQRYDDIMQGQQNIQDAVNFIMKEGSQNGPLLEYKLKKLTKASQMVQLREAIFEHKVMRHKIFDDFNIWTVSQMLERVDMIHQTMLDIQRVQQYASYKKRATQSDSNEITIERSNVGESQQIHEISMQSPGGQNNNNNLATPTMNQRQVQKRPSNRTMQGANAFMFAQTPQTPAAKKPNTGGGGHAGGNGASKKKGGHGMPEQMFIIRTDVSKPYYRFEAKFLKLFQDCFTNFELFKKKNVKNFAEQAQIIAEIGVQIEAVREQINDTQDQIEENDTNQFEDTLKLKEETKGKLEIIEKNQAEYKQKIDQLEQTLAGSERLLQEVQNKVDDHIADYKSEMEKFFSSIQDDSVKQHQVMINQIQNLKSDMKSLETSLQSNIRKDIADKLEQQQLKQALTSGLQMKILNQQFKVDKANLEKQIEEKAAQAEKFIKSETENTMTALQMQLGLKANDNVGAVPKEKSQANNEETAQVNIQNANEANNANQTDNNQNQPQSPTTPSSPTTKSPKAQGRGSVNARKQGVSTNLKLAEKTKILRLQEEKRKKAEIAKQKQLERDQRAAIYQREIEIKEAHFKQQREKEEQYQKQIELRKKQQEERRQRKQEFVKNTKAIDLSRKFVKKLENQQIQDSKQSGQILQKSNQLIAQIQNKTSRNINNIAENNTTNDKEGARGRFSRSKTVKVRSDGDDYDSSDDESSAEAGKYTRQPSINLEELNKKVDEKIGQAKVDVTKFLVEKMGKQMIPLEKAVKQFEVDIKGIQKSAQDQQAALSKKFDDMIKDFQEYKKDSSYDISVLQEQLSQESYGIRRQRTELKGEVKSELAKLQHYTTNANYEFMRINTFIVSTQLILNGIVEDLMLQQLIEEQDVKDRQHIGMFGVKKNSEILGMNQAGASNNVSKSPLQKTEQLRDNIEWDMPNKHKTYKQVSLEQPLKNERKMDKITQQLTGIEPIQDGENTKPFEQKTDLEPIDGSQNVITVSRECASCYGFAPLILSQIKMACLSYTSSPIKYTDGCSMSLTDVLKIKQALLKNMEWTNAELSQFLVYNRSRYKMLPMQEMIYSSELQQDSTTKIPKFISKGGAVMTTQSSQKIEGFEHHSITDSQFQVAADSHTQSPVGMLNRGSDPHLSSATPIFSKRAGRQSQLQKNEIQNPNKSDCVETLPNSEYKFKMVGIDGDMPRVKGLTAAQQAQDASGVLATEFNVGFISPVKAQYLNPKLKYNIPALTQLMLLHKDSSGNKSVKQMLSQNMSNYPTLKINEQDLESIRQASQSALQHLREVKEKNFVRIRSDQINQKQSQNSDLQHLGSKQPKKSQSSSHTKSMTRRVNLESQKYKNMHNTLVDKQYEQLLTQLKEEQDSKSQGQLHKRGGTQTSTKFSRVKGRSNQLINTFLQPTTGSLVLAGEQSQFRGLSGTKLAQKRAQSKIESKSFMSRRQSRGGSNVRTATKVSTDNIESHEQQVFPHVEYQHQMYSGPFGVPRSRFTTRAVSVSRATIRGQNAGHTNMTLATIENHNDKMTQGINHANSRTLETYGSGQTNFLSQVQLDGNNNGQPTIAAYSGQLTPSGTANPTMLDQFSPAGTALETMQGQFEPLFAPANLTQLGPQTTPNALISNQQVLSPEAERGRTNDTEQMLHENKSEARFEDLQILKIEEFSKLE